MLGTRPSQRSLSLPAAERDAAGLPLGVVLQPFARLGAVAPLERESEAMPSADVLPRCADCAAYICGYCQLERDGWVCALCGA